MSPDALLYISSHCPHCPAMLAGLADLVKRGAIGRLEVVNLEARPEAAEGVRSLPWLRLGPFTLTGARAVGELETWARRAISESGMTDAFHDLLKDGDLAQVLALISADPTRLAALLPIVGNPDASINVRLGAGVAFEDHAGSAPLRALIPGLGGLSGHDDARVRADACHYLGLAGSDAVRSWLLPRLDDVDSDVREIAREGWPEQSSP